MNPGGVWLLPVWAAFAATPDPAGACRSELQAMPGVWVSRHEARPLFADMDLIAYLTKLGRRLGPQGKPDPALAILPTYDAVVRAFSRGNTIYVSTGLLIESRDEEDLGRRLGAAVAAWHRRRPREEPVSACARLPAEREVGFAAVRNRLARQVADYAYRVRPRLKIRPAIIGPPG